MLTLLKNNELTQRSNDVDIEFGALNRGLESKSIVGFCDSCSDKHFFHASVSLCHVLQANRLGTYHLTRLLVEIVGQASRDTKEVSGKKKRDILVLTVS